ncbi:zinc-binding oxidoreductase [Talaromyces proteolyticus]|uniref:Zinc-binding oxidoreductase n=1 Tax=Talaromyces proteolyticus TaxID=1131652 RepID=A0AAD4KUI0_9EURO|nr:zinc-binding oxidoreductase [Talaromyces proteolyticus]KAH8700255.1 zinc-binding oxidoreductase [Talaromyces proteolyticus]
MAPENNAAWLTAKNAHPLKVGPAPYTPPGPREIVVRNHAVAINPVDWAKQLMGDTLMGYVKYPFILGGDIAGEVVEVGPQMQRFRVGDRVIGCGLGLAPTVNRAAEGAFQQYVILHEHMAAPIPDETPYEQASVIPLTLTTATYGLFHAEFLGLDLPTVPARANPNGRAVIITGGASSVGSNAVQLAVAAGYEVYSTCSPKNFEYVLGLGATRVFDYHNTGWTEEMIEALRGKPIYGAYTVGDGAVEACTKILQRLKKDGGEVERKIAFAGSHIPADKLKTMLGTASFLGSMIWWLGRTAVVSSITGVKAQFVDTKDIVDPESVVGRVFSEFLPRALQTKQFIPAPEARVVGRGLEAIQEAMDIQAKGVSASKIVVTL